MKKISFIIILIGTLFNLMGCGRSPVQTVQDNITNIGVVTIDSRSAIEVARTSYENLSEVDKNLVNNYDILKVAEETYITMIVDECKTLFENSNFESGRQMLYDNADLMNEEQIEDCMSTYETLYCLSYAEEQLIPQLKDPYSYVMTNARISVFNNTTEYNTDATKMASVRIDFRGTNSFGGYASDTYSVYVYFTPNYDDYSIEIFGTSSGV